MNSLNAVVHPEILSLYILDGNDDNDVTDFIKSHNWKFAKIKVFKESQVFKERTRGKWPIIYNFLMKKGDSPYVTYWSDDVVPDRNCFDNALMHIDGKKRVAAVAFAWQDGVKKPHKIYGTEMYKQPMINFGIIKRTALEGVGWLDENYNFYNADQDLSLKIWYKNRIIARGKDCKVTHYSGKKAQNSNRSGEYYKKDCKYFVNKWGYNKVKTKTVKIM